ARSDLAVDHEPRLAGRAPSFKGSRLAHVHAGLDLLDPAVEDLARRDHVPAAEIDLAEELLGVPRRTEALTALREEDALDELDLRAERPARLADPEEEDERRLVAALLLDEVLARRAADGDRRVRRQEDRTRCDAVT